MMLPKFIITMDGVFRLGMVNQHANLLRPGEERRCIGGGYYRFDPVSSRLVLDRSSYDFGVPKWHLLDVLKVPSAYRGLRIEYHYEDGRVLDVSGMLQVEYVG